jgi:hypothetical protein
MVRAEFSCLSKTLRFVNMFKVLLSVFLLGAQLVDSAPQSYSSIVKCLDESNVPQDYPGTSNFTSDIIPYNLRLNYTPIAVAVPSTVPQVQAAVKCAAKLGVKVNPKSGGHSYASHSLGGEDGHFVVDLKLFRETSVDGGSQVATVGPGARLGNVALALFAQGERALAHGICPGYEFFLYKRRILLTNKQRWRRRTRPSWRPRLRLPYLRPSP